MNSGRCVCLTEESPRAGMLGVVAGEEFGNLLFQPFAAYIDIHGDHMRRAFTVPPAHIREITPHDAEKLKRAHVEWQKGNDAAESAEERRQMGSGYNP